MVKCSIFSSKEEVFKVLHSFLHERDYKRIDVNRDDDMIVAQRRDSVFGKKYSARFIVKAQSDSVCDIEITVNPQHTATTIADSKKEEKIRSRIYFYF